METIDTALLDYHLFKCAPASLRPQRKNISTGKLSCIQYNTTNINVLKDQYKHTHTQKSFLDTMLQNLSDRQEQAHSHMLSVIRRTHRVVESLHPTEFPFKSLRGFDCKRLYLVKRL